MNKQEAIEIIKNIYTLNINDNIAGQKIDMVIKNQVLDIVSQIDEPQKVVVPKFVAEWIVEAEKIHNNLSWVWFSNPVNDELNDWLKNHTETFMRAWLDGYEIEQEKLYKVEVPNNGGTLVLACVNQAIKLVDGNKRFPGKFTKESIENAGFYWALKWAVPVEDN
ncbi:TPA: DUF1642 domain-containing protein [Streptococcus suis]